MVRRAVTTRKRHFLLIRLFVANLLIAFGSTTNSAAAPARKPTAAAKSASPKPLPATLTFDDSCRPGRRAVIAAVGDLLFHDALQAQALRPGQSFRAFWEPVAKVLATADLTYGNLESPIAAGVRAGGYAHTDPGRILDRVVYGRKSDALIFNTHPSVADDLAAAGFDIVSTANNHTADRGVLGMDRTRGALAAAGLVQTGLRASTAEAGLPWSARTTTTNGLTIAWLACTYGLNGMPDPKAQVLDCYRDKAVIFDEIQALASDATVDAVMLTPHWGQESAPTPLISDRRYARDAITAGATAVIGTHPHVLQPWEKTTTSGGRDGLVIYSTGNFISNQKSDDQRTGIIALLELTKPADGAPTRLSAAGFIPTFVTMSGNTGHRVNPLQGTNASIKRLPPGNRVGLADFRALPRLCRTTPNLEAPATVATWQVEPEASPSEAARAIDSQVRLRQPQAVPMSQVPTLFRSAWTTGRLASKPVTWHGQQRHSHQTKIEWIAPPAALVALPSRPSLSPSASLH